MRSSFFEYNVAMTGLFTAKANLNVVGHNISNAATPGYSRQYAIQKASTPIALYNGKGMIGTGSEVTGVGQVRSAYLDKKYWTNQSVLGEYSAKYTHMQFVENLLNESSETGLSTTFNDFFKKLSDLTTTAPDATYRAKGIQDAQSLSKIVNNTAEALRKQQSDLNGELKDTVSQINSLGKQISSINRQIASFELDGSRANDLRDERARLIDQLSEFVNVDVHEMDYSTDSRPKDIRFVVMINGYEFVNHFDYNALETYERDISKEKNPMDVPYLYDVKFANSSVKFDLYSSTLKGSLKGIVDVRDGNGGRNLGVDDDGNSVSTTNYKGIPYYLNKLNDLVRTVAMAFNEGKYYNSGDKIADESGNPIMGHIDGYDAYEKKEKGYYFFTYGSDHTTTDDSFNYNDLNCLNFQVSSELIRDPYRVACSDKPTEESGESNNNVILGFLNIGTDKKLFQQGKLTDFIISITGEIGVEVNHAKKFDANYTDMVANIDNQRISISGVDENEEMIYLVKYQQLYQAAAKLISVIDNIYNTMINGLGL